MRGRRWNASACPGSPSQYIPPTGVSDDVTRPDAYVNRVVNSGLSWPPDYGTFPQIRGPYGNGGYPWTAPDYNNNTLSGTLRIEAENFDSGGKGVAYYNTNGSNPGGQYRTNETVGIEATSDTGGGYDVGWTAAGDWLEYTMEIPEAGTYNLRLRVAGTSAGSVQVLADDNTLTTNGVDLTGQWTLPNTGGAQTWQTVTNSVFLAPGRQKLHINVLAGGFNLNWIELSPASTGPIANGNYKFLNAATAQALDLDTNNNVVTATPSGSNSQQWTLRNIGGGQYEVSSVAKGNSWYTWAAPLHLLPWGWGAGGNTCFIILPTGGGYYRVSDSGGGSPLAPSASSPPLLDQVVWTGAAAQQWAIQSPSAPVFPTGLSATAISATQISLTWNAVSGATSYNVKRSTTSGGPYTPIATGVTGDELHGHGVPKHEILLRGKCCCRRSGKPQQYGSDRGPAIPLDDPGRGFGGSCGKRGLQQQRVFCDRQRGGYLGCLRRLPFCLCARHRKLHHGRPRRLRAKH